MRLGLEEEVVVVEVFTATLQMLVVGVAGRGNAGNAGNPGNPGSAANPTTFNCVSVTPGGSYPVTVNGQIVVSWNPQ